jgi:uncharacterized protein YdaT
MASGRDYIKQLNLPDWASETRGPELLDRAAKIMDDLIAEGYSEEQALEIALERLEQDEKEEKELEDLNNIVTPI